MISVDQANVIALVSLVVRMLAAFFAVLIQFVNKYLADRVSALERTLGDLKADDFRVTRISEAALMVFAQLDVCLTSQHLILSRLADNGQLPERMIARFQTDYRSMKRGLNKWMQTLTVYSSQDEWRRSALKQLSEDLGGADTLVALTELKRWDKELGADLTRAIRDLGKRLDNNIAAEE